MADKIAGIGMYDKVDPEFTKVKPSLETLRIAAMNAAPGQTAEQYIASRGGVNAAGYYGDSWNAKLNLTDAEYFKALNDAKAAGKTGVALGEAINAATAAKRGISLFEYTGGYQGTNTSPKPTPVTGSNYTGGGTITDPLKLNGSTFTGMLGGVNYVNGIKEDTAKKTAQQEFRAALGEMGLADLVDEVDRMIKEDYTPAQIKIELPKTASYKARFPGMEALRAAGRAISEAVYISNEKGYLQTLRAYGLDAAVLGSRSELGKYIANEVSPREFEERVNIAATRVKENPDVIATFKSYFPEADEGGVIAYLLNPKAGMDIIKKQIRVSEIGAAATKAGFARDLVGAKMAESLISAVGDTGYAQIATEFQRARQLANTQRRLAQIEGQQYTDLEAISAVVGDDVTSALASQRRAEREAARFGGAGGVSGASLRSTTAI